MVTLWFWYRFRARPVHLFGGGGLLLFGAGFILAIGVFVARIFFGVSLSDKIWPLVSIFLMLSGIQLFVTGLLADIAIRNYYSVSKEKNYFVREIIDTK